MSRSESERIGPTTRPEDRHDGDNDNDDGDVEQQRSDPDAPGNYVDEHDGPVPEPNEPG